MAQKKPKDDGPPFVGYVEVKKTLNETITSQLVEELIQRKERGMHHLLLSDVNNLMMSIEHDFPDIAKVISIGQSYQGRDINVLRIDASSTGTGESSLV